MFKLKKIKNSASLFHLKFGVKTEQWAYKLKTLVTWFGKFKEN